MTVKRYGISGFGGGMIAQEDGAFYHMDDYDALLSLNAELLEFAEEWLASQGDDENYMTAKARAAIAKARSQS